MSSKTDASLIQDHCPNCGEVIIYQLEDETVSCNKCLAEIFLKSKAS